MARSKIDYCDESWPVVTGCSAVSKGCQNCWAAKEAAGRLRHLPQYEGLAISGDPPRWTGKMRVNWDIFERPLHWRKPRKVFVAPTGDLFHNKIDLFHIGKVFAIMADCPQHTFQILTKRAERMRGFIEYWLTYKDPLPNVWLGVSVESQDHIDRVMHLESIPWPIKWVSLEPLLGEVRPEHLLGMDWVVIGGESGKHARPMHPQWVDPIISRWDGVIPIFFKQWGEWLPWGSGDYTRCWLDTDGTMSPFEGPPPYTGSVMMTRVGKKRAGALLDGLKWKQYPGEWA